MRINHLTASLAIGLLLGGLALVPALSQDSDRGERSGRDRDRSPEARRERMAEMRTRMMQRMQEQLDASDEEWTAMKPLIEQVMEARRGFGRGFAFGGRGRGGRFGRGGEGRREAVDRVERDAPETVQKVRALREILDREDADAKTISRALADLRASRKRAEAKLVTARQELRNILTLRQEAMCVMSGLLD